MLIGHLHIFGETSIQILCLLFNWVVLSDIWIFCPILWVVWIQDSWLVVFFFLCLEYVILLLSSFNFFLRRNKSSISLWISHVGLITSLSLLSNFFALWHCDDDVCRCELRVICPRIWWVSWVCGFIFFIQFGKFLSLFFQLPSLLSLSFLSFWASHPVYVGFLVS